MSRAFLILTFGASCMAIGAAAAGFVVMFYNYVLVKACAEIGIAAGLAALSTVTAYNSYLKTGHNGRRQ